MGNGGCTIEGKQEMSNLKFSDLIMIKVGDTAVGTYTIAIVLVKLAHSHCIICMCYI